jgi:hypothetical protein
MTTLLRHDQSCRCGREFCGSANCFTSDCACARITMQRRIGLAVDHARLPRRSDPPCRDIGLGDGSKQDVGLMPSTCHGATRNRCSALLIVWPAVAVALRSTTIRTFFSAVKGSAQVNAPHASPPRGMPEPVIRPPRRLHGHRPNLTPSG